MEHFKTLESLISQNIKNKSPGRFNSKKKIIKKGVLQNPDFVMSKIPFKREGDRIARYGKGFSNLLNIAQSTNQSYQQPIIPQMQSSNNSPTHNMQSTYQNSSTLPEPEIQDSIEPKHRQL